MSKEYIKVEGYTELARDSIVMRLLILANLHTKELLVEQKQRQKKETKLEMRLER